MYRQISTIKKRVLAQKLLDIGLTALLVTPLSLSAQSPVTEYIITDQVPSPKTSQPNVPGHPVLSVANFDVNFVYNLYYAQRNNGVNGNARTITGFKAGGITFGPYNNQTGDISFTKVVFNRREPAIPLGTKFTALYEYSEVRNSNGQVITDPINSTPIPNNSSIYFDPSFETTMEGFMNSYSLNKGTDNVFVNDGSANNTSNNIERIDLVYSNGVIATTNPNRSRVGFLLNERGGNDAFSVAAITSIDANNNVTGVGPLKKFAASSWGQVGPAIKTVVIQKEGNSSSYKPSQIITTQTVAGVYISLEALDIAANTKIYGIALFPEDAGADLLGLTGANTNTSGASGLDLMSGNFAARDITLVYATLAGTVFHDANGLNGSPVNRVDGPGIGNPGGVQLYANLLDANNIVVLTVPVNNTNGTYSFTNVSPGTYTVQISTVNGSVLDPAPAKTLPTGWANTGESNNGLGTLSDGTPNGLTSITVTTTNISNINFGIQQQPDSKVLSTTIPKPAIGDFITLSGGGNPPILQGSDAEDMPTEGVLTGRSVRITSVPQYSELYYDFGAGPVLVTNETTINGFDPTKLQVKITSATAGQSQTSFEYAFVDVADVADPTPARYTLDWGVALYPNLSGNVFHDANGLNGDPINTVDGAGINNPGGEQLHANLLDENNTVIMTVPVNSNATYGFTSVPPGDYTVQISTISGTVLSAAPDKILPSGWANTGESNNGSGTLSDGTPNGLTGVTITTTDVANINFGIEQLPDSKSLSTIVPKPVVGDFITLSGGSNPPILQGSDPEDLATEDVLTGRSIEITTIPTSSELYYDFGDGPELLISGTVINDFDPTKLQIKITDATIGATETSFEYAFIDAAGLRDPSAAQYIISWGSRLPVTLLKFEVSGEENSALIQWLTTMESNSAHFDVEHSLNGKFWKKLTTVAAKGESAQTLSYFFNHNTPVNGTNYYRLKMVDMDNTYTYSRVRSVFFEGKAFASLYPNPVSDVLFIDEPSLELVKTLEILKINGVSVYSTNSVSKEGVNVKSLPAGLYLLKVTRKDGGQNTQKVVIRR